MNISGDDSLVDKKTGLSIYRLIQELLTNAARHAKANKAVITLRFNKNSILVSVADDGIGINLMKIDDSKSLCIIGMQERVFQLGGTINFLHLEPN